MVRSIFKDSIINRIINVLIIIYICTIFYNGNKRFYLNQPHIYIYINNLSPKESTGNLHASILNKKLLIKLVLVF